MAGSPAEPWSDDPNAPHIPYSLYFAEKANFAGFLIGAVAYGIVIIIFFQCISALLNPVNRGGIKWPLVVHSAAMFSFVTIYTAMNLNLQSISYIDNRGFPGGGLLSPGPLGYQFLIYSKATSVVPNIMFLLNNWLADGLLLYRCYVIYAMNYWAVTIPILMYFASLAMGILLIYYQASQPDTSTWSSVALNFNYPFFTISLSLNLLLTLMIVTRLVLYIKDIRNDTGAMTGAVRWCITVLIESSALYAVTFILFIGPWSVKSRVADIFFPVLAETQVISPFLIILRVANRSALTSRVVTSGDPSPTHFASQERSTGGGGTFPCQRSASSTDMYGVTPGGPGIAVETTIGRDGIMV